MSFEEHAQQTRRARPSPPSSSTSAIALVLTFSWSWAIRKKALLLKRTRSQVRSESGEVSDLISGQQLTRLATNGRSIYSLATLTAGPSSNMADLNIPTSAGGDAMVSFNGLRQNHNLCLVDGGEAADRGGAGGMDIMPSVDAIAEFRILTSNYSAEYGLSSAGTMTMVFNSGTKDFHGRAWEFVRSGATIMFQLSAMYSITPLTTRCFTQPTPSARLF